MNSDYKKHAKIRLFTELFEGNLEATKFMPKMPNKFIPKNKVITKDFQAQDYRLSSVLEVSKIF